MILRITRIHLVYCGKAVTVGSESSGNSIALALRLEGFANSPTSE